MSLIPILFCRNVLVGGVLALALPALCLSQDSPPTSAASPDNPLIKRSAHAPKIVVPARPISVGRPSYPKEARKKKIEGRVVLHAIVTLDGMLNDLTVVSGNPVLADAALEAVRQWRYQPSKINGEPVEGQHEIVITFKKDGGAVYLGPDDLSPHVPPRTAARHPATTGRRRILLWQQQGTDASAGNLHGQPLSVWITKPCGEGLDEKAIEAVQKWRFQPATKDGELVAVF